MANILKRTCLNTFNFRSLSSYCFLSCSISVLRRLELSSAFALSFDFKLLTVTLKKNTFRSSDIYVSNKQSFNLSKSVMWRSIIPGLLQILLSIQKFVPRLRELLIDTDVVGDRVPKIALEKSTLCIEKTSPFTNAIDILFIFWPLKGKYVRVVTVWSGEIGLSRLWRDLRT